MKKHNLFFSSLSLLLAAAVLFSSCTSTTLIQSTPEGAKVYVDGQPLGTTPFNYSDTKIVGSSTTLKLVKEGYEPLLTSFSRNEEVDVGALVGGIFVWIPFLWVMKYKPVHHYELSLPRIEPLPLVPGHEQDAGKTRAERLRELKQLLDEKLITQEDYDQQKARILKEAE